MVQPTELKSCFLIKKFTLGAQKYYSNSGVLLPNIVDGRRNGFGLHDHAAATAKGPVICSSMCTDSVIANIDDPDVNELSIYGLTNN
jgi:hypothetical protein